MRILHCALCPGGNRSLPIPEVLRQVDEAYVLGFREVVLTGIHVGHYGRDLGTDFMELLNRIFEPKEGPRIRLSTLDPIEIDEQLISLLRNEKRLCPHFHVALQSGSNAILRKMRRTYQAEKFVEVTRKIRECSPEAFIGADVIVGFPGETEEEFEETVGCLEKSSCTKLHVFSFSPRVGTPAAAMTDQVPSMEITRRSRRLRNWSQGRYQKFMDSQLGRDCVVLLEKPSTKFEGLWEGHSENYLPTYSKAFSDQKSRELVFSRIVKVEGGRIWTTEGPEGTHA